MTKFVELEFSLPNNTAKGPPITLPIIDAIKVSYFIIADSFIDLLHLSGCRSRGRTFRN